MKKVASVELNCIRNTVRITGIENTKSEDVYVFYDIEIRRFCKSLFNADILNMEEYISLLEYINNRLPLNTFIEDMDYIASEHPKFYSLIKGINSNNKRIYFNFKDYMFEYGTSVLPTEGLLILTKSMNSQIINNITSKVEEYLKLNY